MNVEQLYRYLVHGYKSLYKTSDTFFHGVSSCRRFGPALSIKLARSPRIATGTPVCKPDDTMSYADAVDGARAALVRSVKLRLRADVPLAFCMSGGVDSNSLIEHRQKRL